MPELDHPIGIGLHCGGWHGVITEAIERLADAATDNDLSVV